MNYTEKGSKLYLFSIVLVAEKQAPDDGYQHNREEVEFTAFFCIIHDIND
jgi:hypothetical protein